MSLRFRLNLLISVLFVTILVLGAVLVIHNARRAVLEETQSTGRLALRLLDVASTGGPGGEDALRERLEAELRDFEDTRHLKVALLAEGRETPLAGTAGAHEPSAPRWFARLVEPAAIELRRVTGEGGGAELIVRADPGDEIAESWEDARPLLTLVLVVSVIANGLLYVVIGRWLKPVERIVAAMDGIEQGEYRARLPAFELPELARVATQFNRMAEVLEQSREENRSLARRNLAIQEDERRALAHELHDELGQSISAIKAVAVSIGQARPEQSAEVGAAARTIADISSHVYSVVRGMMRRLRPVLLDELGLVRALQDLVDGWNERHAETFCRLETHGSLGSLGDAVNITVYRVVQECLTNVGKHAGASEVAVGIERASGGDERVRVTISDNGAGFDAASVPRGLGLLGMRERVDALRGTFELDTGAGRGVTIAIELPLAAEAPA